MSVIKCKNDDFVEVVLKSDKPVLVDFNATWCGPCRMLEPIIEELSEENDKYKFVSIDVDEAEDLAREYGIFSIPCLIVFKSGKEVNRNVGFMNKDELEKVLGDK